MSFSVKGIPLAEPAFANAVKGEPTDEIHGVCFAMPAEDVEKLDKVESGYDKIECEFEGYDGRKLTGF